MFCGHLSGKVVGNVCATDAVYFVCRNRNTDTGTTKKNALFGFPGKNSVANLFCVVGIIYGRIIVATKVDIFASKVNYCFNTL